MAYVIPIKTKGSGERGPQVLIVILTKDNMLRMKEGDPFDLQTRAYAQQLDLSGRIRDLDIIVAYEENEARIFEFVKNDDIAGLINYLERGRKHQLGDAISPVSIKSKKMQ